MSAYRMSPDEYFWNEPDHIDRCDVCGAVSTDIDAGFCPSLHGMAHDCGGTWQRVDAASAAPREP